MLKFGVILLLALGHVPSSQATSFDWNATLDDPLIASAVGFWEKVFSDLRSNEGFIHDARELDVIYERVSVEGLSRKETDKLLKKRRVYWKAVLASIEKKKSNPENFTEEEKRIFDLFKNIEDPKKFAKAQGRRRIRFQRGQRDVFERAIAISGRYLKYMEAVFEDEGVPVAITRLPFVESGFNYNARSKVGASGIWQFIRSTGRQFLVVNSIIDERNDPVYATRAAAQLLKKNYDRLGNWPLAILAYNHGRAGVARAVKKVGSSDIGQLIRTYRSRSFGFASRNFFPCLVAAIRVENLFQNYFGEIEREPPLQYVEVTLAHYVPVKALVEELGMDEDLFKRMNLSLTSKVWKGKKRIPKGFRLRIPADWRKDQGGAQKVFWTAYESLASQHKHERQK